MTKILSIICSVFFLLSSANAQNKNAFLISFGPSSNGYGYPIGLGATATNSIPTTNLFVEYGISDRITFGVYGAYTNWYDEFVDPQVGYKDEWKGVDLGVRGTYHSRPLIFKNLGFYLSPFVGYTHRSMVYDKTNIYRDELNYKVDAITIGGLTGLRYWFLPFFGVYAEAGISRKFFVGGGATFRIGAKDK